VSDPELNEDFLDMLSCLIAAQVEFLVVGAHALAAHGIARATGDIDILVRPSVDNAQRVLAALAAFGAPVAAHGVRQSDFSTLGTVYQIGLPPRRIDLLTEITGLDFDEAWASKQPTHIGGLDLHVLGRDPLIRTRARPVETRFEST
jgi:hypothetical protein